MVRIALIHALPHSVEPINTAFAKDWPDAKRMNLMDDSLSTDLATNGRGLDDVMHERFQRLGQYAVDTGAQGILFTCSAFGSCIEAVAKRHATIPVYKPNEAMIADAVRMLASPQDAIGLIASFAPTLASMPPEFPSHVRLETALAEGAMDALNRGDFATHDSLVVEQANALRERGCKIIALSQFSMARARAACEQVTGLPVLTTVDSAVKALRARLG